MSEKIYKPRMLLDDAIQELINSARRCENKNCKKLFVYGRKGSVFCSIRCARNEMQSCYREGKLKNLRKGQREMTIELLQDLEKTYTDVQAQMVEILADSMERGIPPETLRDERGGYIWAPLLVAKAQLLHAIALLTKEDEGQ